MVGVKGPPPPLPAPEVVREGWRQWSVRQAGERVVGPFPKKKQAEVALQMVKATT